MEEKDFMYSTEVATDADFQKRNELINTANKRGYILKKEAEWLYNFDRKARKCNSCSKSLSEAGAWRAITVEDKKGNPLRAALSACCFSCEMKEIWDLGQRGLLD